ncbi:MAG TPA: polyprenyl synthetase family protein [Chloroflexota bacterium]|nr:polyprenyl synthetase family protein [Chloroflexota bacterium]
MSLTTPVSSQSEAIRAILSLVQPGLQRLEASLTSLSATDDPLLGPMLSTVLPGTGKRLRPALALLIGRLDEGIDLEALNHMAVGVELLHTASLVHDDIVDDSDTRRGAATLYSRVGNALAVLVGDYLFSQAAQECVATGHLGVVRLFAETLGAMASGQIDEAHNQLNGHHAWEILTREEYFHTIAGKTASLFVLACQGTGLLVGLQPSQVEALKSFGENIGLAFQVVDDILDFTSTEQELGKPVGSDLRQGTITLPVILLRDSGAADGRYRAAFDSDDVDLQVRLVQESDAIPLAYAVADTLVQRARMALSALPQGVERDALDALARFVTQRGR